MDSQQAFDYLKGLIDSQQRQIDILHKMIKELKATESLNSDKVPSEPQICRELAQLRT
jgi:hypothetical protein